MSLGLGVIGCGSVFAGPYRGMIDRLRGAGRVHVSAVYDVDDEKRRSAAAHYDVEPDLRGAEEVIEGDGVDVVLVLTSMNEHGPLAKAALEAGRHVLVEKPMATSLEEATELLELARDVGGPPRVCAAPPSEPDLPRCPQRRARRAGRRAPHRPQPLWLGRPVVERMVLRARAAGRCSTSACTTSRVCAPCSGRHAG